MASGIAPASAATPTSTAPHLEIPEIVTTPAKKAEKKKDLDFAFPEPAPAKGSHDSSVLAGDAPLAVNNASDSNSSDSNSSDSASGSAVAAGEESAPSEFAFTRAKPVGNSQTSPAAGKNEKAGKKKQGKSLTPLFIGGGVLALLVVVAGGIGLTALLGGFGGKSAKAKVQASAAPSERAFLILDWPEAQRGSSRIVIDGTRMALPLKGQVKFTLTPGSKKLSLQRDGYEKLQAEVSLAKGETSHFAPTWKEIAATGPSFKLDGSGTTKDPLGFTGWKQNVEVAQKEAATGKKDLLIVFGASDVDDDTKDLAKALAQAGPKSTIAASFVPVIIDFPQTASGQSWLDDAHQNEVLAKQYGIRQVPAILLTDEKGQPFFIEREWKNSSDLAKNLDAWKQKRAERDQLLAAARTGDDAARLAAAEKALAWIKQGQFVPSFAEDVRAWHAIAQKIDPANAAGKLEAFVEADLQLRLQGLQLDDPESILQAISPLEDWTGKKRFTDPDRGAALQLLAASVLMSLDKADEAQRHLQEAATYEPKNKELRKRVAAAKGALKYRNVRSSGTGFVISEGGYLLTNHHVVEGEGQVTVRLKGVEQPLPATVVAEDADRDMALIKIEPPAGTKLTPVALSRGKTGLGAAIIALGYPLVSELGEGLTFARGVVSKLPDEEKRNMFILDIRINPGNSGGPVFDSKGNVIGMVTAKIGGGMGGLGDSYGMAIPAPDLLKFVEKHLPKSAPAILPAGTSSLSDEDVDLQLSPAVMLILKMK